MKKVLIKKEVDIVIRPLRKLESEETVIDFSEYKKNRFSKDVFNSTVNFFTGPGIVTLKVEDFKGEYSKRNIFYFGFVWLVSFISLVKNLIHALFIKILTKKKSSIKRILWEIGRSEKHISSLFYDRFSAYNHQAKVGAAGWKSLNLFYNYYENVKPLLKNDLEGWLTHLWIGMMENRQAVTNRKKIAVKLLIKAFFEFSDEPEVRLISVASGSAQAVIDAVKEVPDMKIKVILVDIDRTAIRAAKKLVDDAGLKEKFSFIHGAASIISGICNDFRPHIVEMIGFLDYRSKKQAVRLISKIKGCLIPGGIFLTCNIKKNREKIFLDWVLLWPMIYRTESQFLEVLIEGGFAKDNIKIFYEPFRIHGIAFCKK